MVCEFVALVSVTREGTHENSILPEAALDRLKSAALHHIESAAFSGALARHPKLAILLSLWQTWGSKDDVRVYVDDLVQTPEGTLQLLRSLVVRSTSQGMGDHVVTERHYMRRADIETLISMDALNSRVIYRGG
jgi:hypothetical protein